MSVEKPAVATQSLALHFDSANPWQTFDSLSNNRHLQQQHTRLLSRNFTFWSSFVGCTCLDATQSSSHRHTFPKALSSAARECVWAPSLSGEQEPERVPGNHAWGSKSFCCLAKIKFRFSLVTKFFLPARTLNLILSQRPKAILCKMSWEGDPFYAICGGPFSSIMLYPHDESEKNADDPQEDSWDFVKGPPAPASLPGAKIEENQRNQPGSESKEEALDRAQLSINGTVPLSPLHIDGDSDDMYDYDSDDLYDMRMNLDSDLEYEKYLSYDANILQEEDIEWTTSLSALGFNRRAPGPSK